MSRFTRNLRLRLADDLTSDARFNLERIDQLGLVFPITDSASQSINSSSDIYLNANATVLGGNGQGTVFAPNLQLSSDLILESGAYTLSLSTGTQSSNLNLTLPPNAGSALQFLQTDGTGVLTWADPPTSNFSTLNDTNFTNLASGQVAQYDGTEWVNVSFSATRQTAIYTWTPLEGTSKTIAHGFSASKIQVWIYEPESNSQVFVQSIDFIDDDTILLTSKVPPDTDYEVHLIQTI